MSSPQHNELKEEERYDPHQQPQLEGVNSESPKIEGFDEEQTQLKIDEKIRAGFIIKVYSIVAFQLSISIIFIGCAYIPGYSTFLYSTIGIVLLTISMIGAIMLAILLGLIAKVARRFPVNYILLVLFTIFESFILQFICSSYDYKTVLIAGIMTIGVVACLALYALKTKTDYTWKGAFLCNTLIHFILTGFLMTFLWKIYFLQILYSAFGVWIFSMYLIYDMQLISGKFGTKFSIDDYIMAAINIYLDIINIFLKLLELFGSRNR